MSKWKNKKVAVLLGGITKEREISLKTGTAIAKGLRSRGYDVVEIDVRDGFDLVDNLRDEKPDVAVIALHGKFGEDGCIQGMLEMLRVPYTGGGVLASSVGMDKFLCYRVARELGIRCPEGVMFNSENGKLDNFLSDLNIDVPLVVKPSREGSTINVSIIHDRDELEHACGKALESDNMLLVERYIKGKEVTVGVLNGKSLPTLEIAPKDGFYDYEHKYTKGMTEYIVPARISDECADQIRRWSEAIYKALECDGTARCDFMVTENDEPYFLEINTIPGMTELSLVPKAAAHEGMSFEDVCERLLDGASLKVNV